jgi:hypothetical protein
VAGALRGDAQAALAAKSTTATTSATVSGSATAAGRWSTARFHAWRALSQPASPGP